MTPGPSETDTPGAGGPAAPVTDGKLLREIIKLSCNVLGITLGILCGGLIFVATIVLVIKGGPNVGAHLQLLSQFFPGYRVSLLGSFVGLGYGFAVGYFSGWIIATVYNCVVLLRRR